MLTEFISLDTSKNQSDIIEFKNKIELTWIAKLEETNTHEIVNVDVSPDTTRNTSLRYYENLKDFYSNQEIVKEIDKYDNVKRVRLFELSTMNNWTSLDY
ncbi:hypothetical protein [Cytobacillus firmus]|uniref:hypothetical protein n=1 Tax=Cytobacillus firmus TaxID=1399 RepID=UPI001C8E0E5E|nr:hypothetical protein [Cytobacillus firmus]MBX9972034.1 hypothetical protein [Cytobacillus firmus]